MNFFRNKQSGITLVEVVVAIGISTVILVAVGFSVLSYMEARSRLLTDTKALYLAEEGYEMLRAIRENNWDDVTDLTLNQTYYFDSATSSIATSTTPEVIDGEFYRSFELTEVCRDNVDDDIADCGSGGVYTDVENISATFSVGTENGTTSLTAILTNLHAI